MSDGAMKYGSLAGVSQRVSRLVLGTMSFRTERQDEADALLDRFAAAGGTMIDTAHVYGTSELAIGDWLHRRGRGAMLVLSKGTTYDAGGALNVNPEAIERELSTSLERLGVETIDLYLLHRDDPTCPVGTLLEALHAHAAAGRVRAYGGSNWATVRLEEVNAYARAHGLRPFTASSPNLALAVPNEPMWRDCVYVAGDAQAHDWYRRTRFPLMAWSSQASGFFTGRFSPADTSNANVARVYYRQDNWERLRRARDLAARKGCTPAAVALAWVLHQPLEVFALVGPRTLPELEETLSALAVELSPAETAWLNLSAPWTCRPAECR